MPNTDEHVEPVVKVNANYAAVMPFGFIKDLKNPDIVHNTKRQWFGETRAGAKQYSESLQAKGVKIMIANMNYDFKKVIFYQNINLHLTLSQ